ncbi:MAG TPA: hypothetical protein VMT61_07415 [Candidatus Binataceae bacterium]|nr:hypothetical protein [Candidatus Binataceae bacterium]
MIESIMPVQRIDHEGVHDRATLVDRMKELPMSVTKQHGKAKATHHLLIIRS